MSPDPYAVLPARIEEITIESPSIRTLRLRPERPFAFKAGQFLELSLPGVGEAPFTPSSSPAVTDVVDVTVMKAGFVTEHIHRAEVGDLVGLRGPYGKGYPLEEFEGRRLLILGGGCGLAPLRSLFLALLESADRYQGITFLTGAKTPEDYIYKDAFPVWAGHPKVNLVRAVDTVPEGACWSEDVCLVTGLLDKLDFEPVDHPGVVCGPPVMMKFGTLELLKRGFRPDRIYLSLEKKMYCGFGQCRHCLVGGRFVCKDGPVFRYDTIKDEEGIWD